MEELNNILFSICMQNLEKRCRNELTFTKAWAIKRTHQTLLVPFGVEKVKNSSYSLPKSFVHEKETYVIKVLLKVSTIYSFAVIAAVCLAF